jgi:hypothetical protein
MTLPLLTYCHPRHAFCRAARNSSLGFRNDRRGTSLLEVMFAMGVSVIGLLGVAALIPVAAHRMGRGIQADQVAAYGRAMVGEFEVRGMARRDGFVWPDNGNDFNLQNPGRLGLVPGAFCFDPLTGAFAPTPRFPALPSAPVHIPRVTWRPLVPPMAPGDVDARQVLVDSLFRFNDDLVFNRPTDRTLPPIQLFDSRPVATEIVKRQYNGRYTWMATLSPNPNVSSNGFYTLSIVVFDGRDPNPENEIVLPVEVEFGEGGGEVEFEDPANPGVTLADLKLRPDHWIMLITRGTPPVQVRWYRIASADSQLHTGHLHGFLRGADIAAGTYEGVVIKSVVGVFEKTVRLEGSSLFTIQ